MENPYHFSIVSQTGHVMRFMATMAGDTVNVHYHYLAPHVVRDGAILLRPRSTWVLAMYTSDASAMLPFGIPWREVGQDPFFITSEICRTVSHHFREKETDDEPESVE